MSQIIFDGNDLPHLADLDTNLSVLFSAVLALYPSATVTITPGTDSNGNPIATFGVADPLSIGTLSVTTQFSGASTSASAVAAGNIGEYSNFYLSSGSAVTMTPTSGTTPVTNIISGTFTKGNWLFMGNVIFVPGGQSISSMIAGVSVTSVTLPNDYSIAEDVRTATVPVASPHLPIMPVYIRLSTTTTVYLVAQAVCGGAITAYGNFFGIRQP